jgi:hypothetical protein
MRDQEELLLFSIPRPNTTLVFFESTEHVLLWYLALSLYSGIHTQFIKKGKIEQQVIHNFSIYYIASTFSFLSQFYTFHS